MTKKPGRFITLEGGEGAGKSTQAKRLAAALEARGISTVITREPGGSPGAEDIRKLLVQGETGRWVPLTETLLLYAARADHVARTIKPALAQGQWVICDRFADSSYAYQGAAAGLDRETIRRIESVAIGDFKPDFTLILDLPSEEGLKRANKRGRKRDALRRIRCRIPRKAAQGVPRYRQACADALCGDRRDHERR